MNAKWLNDAELDDTDNPDAADWNLARVAYFSSQYIEPGPVRDDLLEALGPYRWYLDAEPDED